MGFRFKKVIKIAPGVKLNISKSGVSTSFGGRGASLNVGKNGVKGTLGIPGSGLSYSKQLMSNSTRIPHSQSQPLPVPADIILNEQGKPVFVDGYNSPFPSPIQTKLKQQYTNELQLFLEEKKNEINHISNEIENIHGYFYPSNFLGVNYEIQPFPTPAPSYDSIFNEVKQRYGFSLFQQGAIKQEADNIYQQLYREYHSQKQQWDMQEQDKVQHVYRLKTMQQRAATGDVGSMELFLQELLPIIPAPIRFSGSFEVECAEGIWLDIDLPEIEEIPTQFATITSSGSLSIKNKTQKKLKEEYSRLVSGIAIILAQYIYTYFPTVESVVISGYTQRLNKSTGHIEDDYIYSLLIQKETLRNLNINYIEPLDSLVHFSPIMNVTKSLEWKTISPYYRI